MIDIIASFDSTSYREYSIIRPILMPIKLFVGISSTGYGGNKA
jgi:hypothetical protein